MEIEKVNLVYFSPTHTTKKILEGISQGIQAKIVEHFDLTLPEADTGSTETIGNDLTIFGIPVYGGRVPLTALERLQRFKGQKTPAVVVAVYGNREFEDALLELKNLVVEAGFKPLAGGAFIGEHSFSKESLPIAEGRPDNADEDVTRSFGQKILEKLKEQKSADDISIIEVPGNFPHKERSSRGAISPITQEDDCTQCETCASVCPTGAITVADTVVTDAEKCILCCACVKNCPSEARVMDNPNIQKMAEWLNTNCSKRKDPETFI
jgi:ferredoxin